MRGLHRNFRESGLYEPEGFFGKKSVVEPKLMGLIGLVALGTVADVVPLRELNRAYVTKGLPYMQQIPGIKALVDRCNVVIAEESEAKKVKAELVSALDGKKTKTRPPKFVKYDSYACGFVIGPCLNAAGRIDDCMQASTLLISDDVAFCEAQAHKLHGLNRQRQQMQEGMVNASIASVEAAGLKGRCIVAYGDDWHPGVIGLAASKLKDRYDVPCVVIGQGGKGSGRSIKGFNLGQAFIDAYKSGLLIKGGGHAAAAGLTIDPDKVPEFEAFLCARTANLEAARVATNVDMSISPGELSVPLVEAFTALMEPFGMGNSKPRIVVKGGVLSEARVQANDTMKAVLRGPDGTSEAMVWQSISPRIKEALMASEGCYVDVLATPGVNEHMGRKSVQLTLEDLMVGPLYDGKFH